MQKVCYVTVGGGRDGVALHMFPSFLLSLAELARALEVGSKTSIRYFIKLSLMSRVDVTCCLSGIAVMVGHRTAEHRVLLTPFFATTGSIVCLSN